MILQNLDSITWVRKYIHPATKLSEFIKGFIITFSELVYIIVDLNNFSIFLRKMIKCEQCIWRTRILFFSTLERIASIHFNFGHNVFWISLQLKVCELVTEKNSRCFQFFLLCFLEADPFAQSIVSMKRAVFVWAKQKMRLPGPCSIKGDKKAPVYIVL